MEGAMQGMLSPNLVPVDIVQTLDPRVKLGNKRAYAVFRGAKEVTPQRFPATSVSDTNVVFDVNPPSSFILVDKEVWITCPFLVTFTGADQGSNLLQIGVNDAPRSYPLMQSILSTRATINNTTVSVNSNNVMQALLWYHNNYATRRELYSGTPAMLDQAQNYSDLTGAVRNPLAGYGDNTAEEARGAGLAPSAAALIQGVGTFAVLSNTHTAAQVLMIVQEPIYLSPFLFGSQLDEAAFYGINKMTIQLLMGDLTRVWSHSSSGNVITTITSSITGAIAAGAPAPQAQFQYLTPKEIPELPLANYYPYFEVIEYVTPVGAVAPLTLGSVTTNSIYFPTIPRRCYIFLRQQNSDRTYLTSDVFAFINSISITFANRTGLLQSQTPQSLYNLSSANGYEGSWEQWSAHTGSVLAIDFGKDIGLAEGEAPGMSSDGQYQFTVTINFMNINASQTINFQAYIVAIQEGTMLIEQNHAMLATGVVTKQDVYASLSAPSVPYHQTERIYGGGSFWSDLRSGLANFGKAALKYAPKIAEGVIKYAPLARSLVGVGGSAKRRRLTGRGFAASNSYDDHKDSDSE